MRVFVDTSTLVSGLLFEGNESVLLELGAFGAVDLTTTRYVLDEVQRILGRAEFDLTEREVRDLIGYLHRTVVVVDDPSEGAVRARARKLTDKKGAQVWAGFDCFGIECLVTGDKELLRKVRGAVRTLDLLSDVLTTS